MQKAVIYTIPSTGTRFVLHALQELGGYRQAYNMKEFLADTNLNALCQFHVQSYPDKRLDWTAEFPYVVSLRHPVLSFLTQKHVARKHGPNNGWLPITISRWAWMAQAVEGRNVFFFPVQVKVAKDRKDLLKGLAKHVGVDPVKGKVDEIAKEWPVVGKTDFVHNEKREWLRTLKEEGVGTITGIDLTPLNPAIAWYEKHLGGRHVESIG